ncbi:type III pantothenate kinase [Thiohalomonas denitrificans]|uniref:Type III pantothenate kinase n=1 Tax=Thiohalomonas denitrificans TaxID=415747 RepID=A0A1G5R2Z4_9GAMM|nr:type III pantothenate kinase [Thiohalomonas denitrificans]SCZ68432.1 type III pantothenate kinase [Thiohalomonas denitrificans]
MLLAIDLGNTRLKWGVFDEGGLQGMGAQPLSFALEPEDWSGLHGVGRPERVAIASVGGELRVAALQEWLTRQWQCPVLRLQSTAHAAGVANGYREPARLGVDRWAALIAARSLSTAPTVVVDAGSACTIDAMDSAGRHKGGWIAPGLRLMESALLEGTREVSIASESILAVEWGVDTTQGVKAGQEAALAGMVERAVRHLEREEKAPVECLLTGGDGGRLKSLVETPCRYDPALVLKGIARLAGTEALWR